jgi:hypothetical protein
MEGPWHCPTEPGPLHHCLHHHIFWAKHLTVLDIYVNTGGGIYTFLFPLLRGYAASVVTSRFACYRTPPLPPSGSPRLWSRAISMPAIITPPLQGCKREGASGERAANLFLKGRNLVLGIYRVRFPPYLTLPVEQR